MSSCTTTVPNSVRNSAPVGQTSRHAAWVQCLQTSDDISQRNSSGRPVPGSWVPSGLRCSMNATCRQVSAPSPTVLSIDMPVNASPSSGMAFHSLHATSQALHPMQTEVSVKNPIRGGLRRAQLAQAGSVRHDPRPVSSVIPARRRYSRDQRRPRRPARPPTRSDVAGQRFGLHDVHVRVHDEAGQVVRGITGDQPVRSPVVGQTDLVQHGVLHPQRRDPVGHQHPCLDGVARGDRPLPSRRASRPRSAASSGDTSQNGSGASSAR